MVHLTNQLIIKMEKQKNIARILALAIICATILMIGVVSAQTIYGGESFSFETNFTNSVYTVTGNSSNLEGLNITFANNNITVSIVSNYKPDNFTMVFFDNLTHEIIKEVRVGGGTRTKIEYKENRTLYPVYLDQVVVETKEVEVPIETIIETETGFEWWHVLLACAVAVIVSMLIVHFYLEDKAKDGVD